MSGYFYHGIEPYLGNVGYSIEVLIKILEDGIKTRDSARGYDDIEMNHVCLYKKMKNSIMIRQIIYQNQLVPDG